MKLFLRPNGKLSFLKSIPKDSNILDVGCGNNSPILVKSLLPSSYYVGLDVENYNNNYDVNEVADQYILSHPNDFVESLNSIDRNFDAIISSHNLEHCNDRVGTLNAMINKLTLKGKIYLSFPSKESINFPKKRKGCLNYYDDLTHRDSPPDFDLILEIMRDKGLKILYFQKSYKPLLLSFIGIFTNLVSHFTKRVYFGVWENWGFESIIIVQKT